MAQENKLERFKSKWLDVEPEERSRYISQNYSKSDCSFLVKDARNGNSQKILKSFQWILSDSSPYFKQKFESNSNCKETRINDPCFEDILCYIHTRFLPDQSLERLLDLYESAKIFEIDGLGKVIMDKLNFMIAKDSNRWIDLFIKMEELSFEFELKSALWTNHKQKLQEIIERSINKIITFDLDLLITFLNRASIYVDRPVLLKTIETFIEKNPLFGETVKKSNLTKSAFVTLLYFDNGFQHDLQQFQSYPKILELLE